VSFLDYIGKSNSLFNLIVKGKVKGFEYNGTEAVSRIGLNGWRLND
jgi:hypothetical protein